MVWKNILFTILIVFVIFASRYYVLGKDLLDQNTFDLASVIFFFLVILFLFIDTYQKVSFSISTLLNNFKNALSGEWSKVYPLNSSIAEFKEIEKYFLYLIDIAKNGRTTSEKLLELKESQTQFLNKKFTEDVSKLRLAIDSVLDIIVLVDKFGYINYANKTLGDLIGINLDEAENKKITDLWHRDNEESWKKSYEEVLQTKKPVSFSSFGIKKGGLQFEAFVQISPIRNSEGNIDHFLVVERDITEEKQKERIKSEFISVVSHELRTPMTVIRGYAALLAEGQLGELNEKQKEYVNKINSQTQQLLELANDMLDIQKFESGKITLNFEKTNIPNFVKEIVEQNQDLYTKKNLKLSLENNLNKTEANIDVKYFTRAISNLLSNAYKYTEKGEVKVFLVNPDEEHIVIAVKDTGVGIKEEALNHLFERFYQADGVMQRKQEGSGLGLSIVKKVVESHNGMVWVESKVGVGSTFYIAIPV